MAEKDTTANDKNAATTANETVAPSVHFSVADAENSVEYECETRVVDDDDQQHGDDSQEQSHAIRRASRRMSQRESITGATAPFDVSFHPGQLILYCRPRQRQRWGESQVLPRVNWGDLFYDLFYVAAAYNTSNILVDSPSGRSLLYFLATFYAVMGLWLDKVFYDARFVVVGDDIFHRVFELAVLVVLATAVLHIRTIGIMENGAHNMDSFVFCVAILIGNLLVGVRYAEVYLLGIGQSVIKREAKRWFKMAAPNIAMLLAATIIAGIEYYGNSSNGIILDSYKEENVTDSKRESYNDEGYPSPVDKDHRWLAASTSYAAAAKHESFDIPFYLVLGGYFARWVHLAFDVRFCFPGGGHHKEFIVPINVDFTIHRYGEYTMLMLGESILSILIVDVEENKDYYATFYSALLTVVLLQFLHFCSQPHKANGHALRRDKDAGVGWNLFYMIYSAALIAVGSAFTLMMLEFTYGDYNRRFLAGGGGADNLDSDIRRQQTANLFCGSLTTVWISLDCMTIFHLGLKSSQDRCQCAVTKSFNVKGIALLICRVGLLVFMATLSQYETGPQNLAMIGLAGVVLQLALRKLGTMYLSGERVHAVNEDDHGGHTANDHHKRDPEDLKWPNVTRAQAHSP